MSKRTMKTVSAALDASDNPQSKSQNPNSGRFEQSDLSFQPAEQSGPVECLGMTFPSDDERRKYFLEKLAEKLKDPEFRKIEGFPIGEDEDILALSDPPYYTACPNPWLADFVKHYGTPYNPKKPYHREPFAADVSEGRYSPETLCHSYHTKVPARCVLSPREPADNRQMSLFSCCRSGGVLVFPLLSPPLQCSVSPLSPFHYPTVLSNRLRG
jgi:hypothetical protein